MSSFPVFLNDFFPEVLGGKSSNAYCTYNSQKLQMFTSSYFLAGMSHSMTDAPCGDWALGLVTFYSWHLYHRWQRVFLTVLHHDLVAYIARKGAGNLHNDGRISLRHSLGHLEYLLFNMLYCDMICILQVIMQRVYHTADWRTQLSLLCCRCCCRVGVSLVECTTWTQMVHGHCWSLVFHWCCHQCRSSGPGHAVPWPNLPWFWCWFCQPVGRTRAQPALKLYSAHQTVPAQSIATGSVLPNLPAHQRLVHYSFSWH